MLMTKMSQISRNIEKKVQIYGKRDIFVYFINRSAFGIQNNENKVAK